MIIIVLGVIVRLVGILVCSERPRWWFMSKYNGPKNGLKTQSKCLNATKWDEKIPKYMSIVIQKDTQPVCSV